MYDIEVASETHNFCLPNGVITSNSHSICYSIIAYACAYLKYYFPLEWWCAVLKNADKDEIGIKFWKYCKDFVQLPDVTKSGDKFTINDDKIVAPLDILLGVGPAAQLELSENMPYKDLGDFCNKIINQKLKTRKWDDEKQAWKAGKSALNIGVINKLIIGGTMDSFFPPETPVSAKIEKYIDFMSSLLTKKMDPIKPEYANLNKLSLYQYRKSILAIYSEYLAPFLYETNQNGIKRKVVNLPKGDWISYSYLPDNPKSISEIMGQMGIKTMLKYPLPFVDGAQFNELNASATIEEGKNLKVAVAAYVSEYRRFEFKDKKEPKGPKLVGHEFVLDIDGNTVRMVKWPNWNDKSNKVPSGELEGAIIVAIVSKRKEFEGFKIEAVDIIQPPLSKKEEK